MNQFFLVTKISCFVFSRNEEFALGFSKLAETHKISISSRHFLIRALGSVSLKLIHNYERLWGKSIRMNRIHV